MCLRSGAASWSEAELAPPDFHSDRGRDEFVATLFVHNLLDDDDIVWLGHFSDLNLTTDEAKALVFVREIGQITNAVYRDLSGADTLEASSHLRRLRSAGLLVQHDRGAATFYTPGPRLQNPEGRILPVAVSGAMAKEAHERGEKSGELGEKSGDLEEKSGDLEEKSGDLGGKSGDLELPPELAKAVAELNRWTPQPGLRRLIARLCTWRPMSAAELARVLGRTQTYLRTSYLGPMVHAGELAHTIPGKPNDPNQRYRATGVQFR